ASTCARRPRGSRSGGSARPRTSRTRSSSWPRRAPPTSPASRSPSTAASSRSEAPLPTRTISHATLENHPHDRPGRPGARPAPRPVPLLAMGTPAGQVIRLPRRSGSDIYQGVYYALVVYAERYRISLHYARTDYIAPGYGLHLDNVCVDPSLLALYRQANASG